jgi:hypothetical protein
MARRDEVKKALLDVAGNPSVGLIAEWVDRFADAVVALDEPKPKREFDARETRVVGAKERRQ